MSDPQPKRHPGFFDELMAGLAAGIEDAPKDGIVERWKGDMTADSNLNPERMMELGLWLMGQSIKTSVVEGMSRDE